MKPKISTVAAIALIGSCLVFVGCGDETVTATDTGEAPILAPQNVTVSQNAFGEVMVSWDRNTQVHLRGYNVYRLDVVESAIATLTANPITETFHVDRAAAADMEYEYRVTSVSARGNESAYIGSRIEVQARDGSGAKLRPERP